LATFVLQRGLGIPVFAAALTGRGQDKVPGFMARTLGEPGRYVSQEATRRSHAIWSLAITTIAVVGTLFGFVLRSSLHILTLTPVSSLLLSVVLLLLICLVASQAFRRMDALEKERESMRKGAAGEESVADTLSKLPDEFLVVNDVQTPNGNLDHAVIGPTGVFVIETKNCRGIIGADGKGELTLNGKPATKAHVKRFVGRMMATKERVRVLAPGLDPFFQAVMVFTSAWVNANFGTTGMAHCIRDDRLLSYILDEKWGKKLSTKEVSLIGRAFAGLARMEPGFSAKAELARETKTAHAAAPGVGEVTQA